MQNDPTIPAPSDPVADEARAREVLPRDRYDETAFDRILDYAENGTMPAYVRDDLRTVLSLITNPPLAFARETSANAACGKQDGETGAVANWKIVPVEPTEEMLEASAIDWTRQCCGYPPEPGHYKFMKGLWSAMLSASPNAASAETGEVRDRVAGMIALAGLGTNTGEPRRPHDGWKADEFETRIMDIVPTRVVNQCYALADRILALTTAGHDVRALREACELALKYDDLLRSYAGPQDTMLLANDAPKIDAAYDRWIAAARSALAQAGGKA